MDRFLSNKVTKGQMLQKTVAAKTGYQRLHNTGNSINLQI